MAQVKKDIMLKYLWLTTLVLLLDQSSKFFALQNLVLKVPEKFLPYFNFMLIHNEGAAFSLLSSAGGWQRWFFLILSAGISIFIILWLKKLKANEKLLAVSLSLILGGAIGNLIDRVIHEKGVVDFIDWFYYSSGECLPLFFNGPENTCHWPTFNLADSAILLGAVLLIVQAIIHKEDTQ